MSQQIRNLLILSSIILLFGGYALAENVINSTVSKVSVSIVPQRKKVTAGMDLRVLAKFIFPEDWHIYGTEPGAFGIPTEVKIVLLEAGKEIAPNPALGKPWWPKPEESQSDEGEVSYVYRKPFTVSLGGFNVSKALLPGAELTLKLEARWLACSKEVCIPEKREFTEIVRVVEKYDDAPVNPEFNQEF
ncbi:MAG: hypothetical protein KDD60_08365, partial [Bdellovibrionales bacterium]|nr:hypothetical protein [Bdellovibrionales bacterium]